jgi:hypothetical protein
MFYLGIRHRDHFVIRRGWVLGFFIDIHVHVICHIFNIKNTNENKAKKIGIMVFKTTFNNISVISWWPVLLVEKTEVHRENH